MEQTQKIQSKSPTVRDEEPTDWWQSRLGGFAATFSFFTLVCLISVLNGFPLLDLVWFRVSEDAESTRNLAAMIRANKKSLAG